MKIAILSDAHDNIVNTQIVVQKIQEMGAEVLIFCGDFCATGVGLALTKFKGPIHAVFGNNDGDKFTVVEYTKRSHKDISFYPEGDGAIELDGRRIALTHYPRYANALARTGDYDLVCFGHDHVARIETYGDCIAVNPGTLNFNPFRKDAVIGFGIYDTAAHKATLYNLEGEAVA